MHNLIKKFFGPIFIKKIYFLWGCNYSLTSQGGHLQLELNGGDTLFQQTSTIPGVKRPSSAGKFRNGSSTLILSKIATAEELLE